MLKTIVSLLFFLLMMTAGQGSYCAAKPIHVQHTHPSVYQQSQTLCSKTMDYLFINRFADLSQSAVVLDNHDGFKAKCVLRLLAALDEWSKQELQSTSINLHSCSLLHADAIAYYIYALRKILI